MQTTAIFEPQPTSTANPLSLQVDWLLSNLRWLFVASAAIVIALRPQADMPRSIILVLVASVAYNVATAFLLSMRWWPQVLSLATLILDTFLAVAFFYVSGAIGSPLLFMAFLPILTASLRYNWVMSLVTATMIGIGYSAAVFQALPPVWSWVDLFPLLLVATVLYTLAVTSGLLSHRLVAQFLHQHQAMAREERRRLEASRDRARLIYELAATLSATLSYERVLEAALDVIETGLRELGAHAGQTVVLVLLIDDARMRVAAAHGLSRAEQRLVLPGASGSLAEALDTAEPVVVDDIRGDPELRVFDALLACKQAIVLPLRAGFENYGALVFGSPGMQEFTAEHQELFKAIANHTIIALQNAQLYHSLAEEKQRILDVDTEARKKLARELHDGPIQGVAAIAMRTNFTRRLLERDVERSAEELRKIEELARRTSNEMRHMLFTMRPLVLETQGLRAALQQLAEKMAETHGQNVVLEIAQGLDTFLDRNRQTVVFFLIEEAVNNARKHAQADHIWVRLFPRQETFVVEIEDDGRGFDVSATEASYQDRANSSLGMVNMRERADLIGANLTIRSNAGKGTRISALIPLEIDTAPSRVTEPVASRAQVSS